MKKKTSIEIIYKEQLTHLLLWILDIAGQDIQNSKDFEEDYKKRLKFQKKTDWKRYRASVDLLDDTEYALISFFKYQLGDVRNKNNDPGELYLRLYGILNAVYLQMNAFKELSNLLNYPDRNNVPKSFECLDIYKLRGIAGAHTVDYLYDKETLIKQKGIQRSTSFRIYQMYLEKTGGKIEVIDENDLIYTFNLMTCLLEYEKIATELLLNLIHHSIKSLVSEKKTKKKMQDRLKEYLSNLVDYSKLDENRKYKEREHRKLKKEIENLRFEDN
jgi:hypothetical protein